MAVYHGVNAVSSDDVITGDRGEFFSMSSTPLHSRTSNFVAKGRHEWTIEDFVRREEGNGVSLQTRFTVPAIDNRGAHVNTVWRIKLYPKGCDQEHSEHVSIFLNQVSGPGSVWVKYSISLIGCHAYNRTTYVHNTRRGTVQFEPDRRSSSRGWKKFIPLESICNPGSSLLHDGALLIRCNVEIQCRDKATAPAGSHQHGIEERPVNKTSSVTSSNHSFFDEMKYSDMMLICEGREFNCHKFMLAKKSDVFDAMFSHNFSETSSGKVFIEDLQSEAVAEMLRYIYTGHVHGLEKVNRILLAAADKYNIVDLKEACERSLCSSMTVESVSSLLLFARDRHFSELKNKAIEFISRNIQAVTESEGWQELVKVPTLMTEVVRAMGPRI